MNAGEARRLVALMEAFAPDAPSIRNPSFTAAQAAGIHLRAIEHLADAAPIPALLAPGFEREYGHLCHLLQELP